MRKALIQRVSRKVSGHGIARRSIEGAVDRVLAALAAGMAERAHPRTGSSVQTSEPEPPAGAAGSSITAVLSAASAPDLASRARRALERDGQRLHASGSATAGRHTVLTVRVPAGSEPALARVAGELGASLAVLDPASARQVGA